jgi:hypothetical protein
LVHLAPSRRAGGTSSQERTVSRRSALQMSVPGPPTTRSRVPSAA